MTSRPPAKCAPPQPEQHRRCAQGLEVAVAEKLACTKGLLKAGRIWLGARDLDPAGRGWVPRWLLEQELAQCCYGPTQIQVNIQLALRLGWLAELAGGRLAYRSVKKVAATLGVPLAALQGTKVLVPAALIWQKPLGPLKAWLHASQYSTPQTSTRAARQQRTGWTAMTQRKMERLAGCQTTRNATPTDQYRPSCVVAPVAVSGGRVAAVQYGLWQQLPSTTSWNGPLQGPRPAPVRGLGAPALFLTQAEFDSCGQRAPVCYVPASGALAWLELPFRPFQRLAVPWQGWGAAW